MDNYIISSGYYNPHSMQITLKDTYKSESNFIEFVIFNKNILPFEILKNINSYLEDFFGLIIIQNITDKFFFNVFPDFIKIKKNKIKVNNLFYNYEDIKLKVKDNNIFFYDINTEEYIYKLDNYIVQKIDPDLDLEHSFKYLQYENDLIQLKSKTSKKRTIKTFDTYFYPDVEINNLDNELKIVFNSIVFNLNSIKLSYCSNNDRINLCVSSGISLFLMTLIGYTL
jgi:hypothetical protein